ncbi:glycosyltransferase family 4 protein [Blautia obeum]|uniref:glycosyltransferase family 4 protein n=1 Tax=Blautia obeum TaxID=40520 RepID=UPI0034A232FC
MKIAIIINELNIKGGTHKQVLRLCQYLREQNIEFVIVTKYFDPMKTYTEFSDFDIKYLSKDDSICELRKNLISKVHRFIKKSKLDRKLYALIPKDCDIINVHDYGLDRIIKYAENDHRNVVWQINDLPGWFNVGVTSKEKDSIEKKMKRWITRYCTKNVDAITVNVTKNAERVQKCLNKSARVLYCGVDVNEALIKHHYKEGAAEFRLLSMGVFFPYRNYETLVEVIKKLREDSIHIRLDIIGNTEWDKKYTEKISSLISEYKLDRTIKIWGQVDDETYTELFNEADAFAFINIEQSWGLAVFEAMSAGLPTIVSNSVGAIELLHNGKDSIIVNPQNVDEISDVLKHLLIDSDYYNRISDEAARVVKEFTWEKLYSSKMLEIFEKMEKKR